MSKAELLSPLQDNGSILDAYAILNSTSASILELGTNGSASNVSITNRKLVLSPTTPALMFAFGLATIFVLGAMATDRYLALNKPYFYSAKVTVSKIKYILFSMWLAAFLIACLPLIGVGEFIIQFPGSWCFFNFYGKTPRVKSFAYIYSIVGISVVLTIAVLNMIVVKTLIRMNNTTRLQKQIQKRRGSIMVRCMDAEIQMAMFLIGILAVFSTCWAPLMVRILLIQTELFPDYRRLDLLLVRFASFNQILDPWVYILFRKSLFSRVRTILKLFFCRSAYKVSKQQTDKEQPLTITTENMVSMDMSDFCCSTPSRKPRVSAEESMLKNNI
ncbi:hypothetical protein FSP39_024564 [Pinctada imbricata]|uniref:G-protein coupled receptors family 1 profile domain-containing protein n=1 Tax=Pinctada imbricata TaxID=66713 RepID=A0AA88Y1C2_PINIB|nr:hypothetical protein FSP39_024564 [Pinctada imbricata]